MILAEAREKFRALPKDNFTELMALHSPPPALALVCGAALIALGMPEDKDWSDIKKRILGDVMEFRSAVLQLEPADIKDQALRVLPGTPGDAGKHRYEQSFETWCCAKGLVKGRYSPEISVINC